MVETVNQITPAKECIVHWRQECRICETNKAIDDETLSKICQSGEFQQARTLKSLMSVEDERELEQLP